MRVIETQVFKFSELSESAKEKAREWYRKDFDFSFHQECAIDDIKECASILGIEIDNFCYSGFWSQGDGAAFSGSYSYARGSVKAIAEHAPLDLELLRIARELQKAQRPFFYQLRADCSLGRGNNMRVSVEHSENPYRDIPEDDIERPLQNFASWAYRMLEKEYDYQTSDDTIADTIEANEYEFTEQGAFV